MTVATFEQPDYTSQGATAYKNNIDAAIAVLKHLSNQGAAHERDPIDDKVEVDPISHWDGGTIESQGLQTTSSFTFPSSEDRIDRIVFNESDLSIDVLTGTESSSPSPPAIPDDHLPCCQIRLSPSDTQIDNSMITDERGSHLFYAIHATNASDATNVTSTYKGNDIDNNGDGTVDKADDSNQYDGVDPIDGTDGQVYTTDGTNGSFEDVNLDNTTGTSSGDYNSEEVTQTISSESTETVNVSEVSGYVEGNASKVDEEVAGGSGQVALRVRGTTTNGNGNLNGMNIENRDESNHDVTVRFSGIVE